MAREKARWELHKNVMSYIAQILILEATPHETTAIWLASLKPSKQDEQDIQVTVGEARMNLYVKLNCLK